MADPEQCLQVESPEVAACEGDSADLGAVEGSSSMAAEDEAASQALERLESAGEAACCLNDTFEVGPRTQMHSAPHRLKASLLLGSPATAASLLHMLISPCQTRGRLEYTGRPCTPEVGWLWPGQWHMASGAWLVVQYKDGSCACTGGAAGGGSTAGGAGAE